MISLSVNQFWPLVTFVVRLSFAFTLFRYVSFVGFFFIVWLGLLFLRLFVRFIYKGRLLAIEL